MKYWWRLRARAPRTLPVAEAYARWAPSYAAEAHNPLMTLEEEAMLGLLPAVRGARALDLGCGSGRYLAKLEARGAARLAGLDLSPEMLARAAGRGRGLARGDLRWLPFAPESFDVIVCGLAVGHVPELASAVAEMARVLAPGGHVLYSDFHPLAALAGLQRTFRGVDGRGYAVEHHVHLYGDHHAACQAAGLQIDAVAEPRLTGEHAWRGRPAVLVLRARRA